jgi:hypothetical protein
VDNHPQRKESITMKNFRTNTVWTDPDATPCFHLRTVMNDMRGYGMSPDIIRMNDHTLWLASRTTEWRDRHDLMFKLPWAEASKTVNAFHIALLFGVFIEAEVRCDVSLGNGQVIIEPRKFPAKAMSPDDKGYIVETL